MPVDIAKWLQELGLGGYVAAFADHAIDEDVLFGLTEADLEKIGVKLGHRNRRLCKSRFAMQPAGDISLNGDVPALEDAVL